MCQSPLLPGLYMVQWPGGRILHRHELDTFLAQAVSTQLYEPDQLQELKIEKLDARGIQLAALFMSGVDTALFANDACGQPVPWEHCCPWIYFDGKLFQSKLIKAGRERVSLVELCDGQSTSDGVSKSLEPHQSRSRSQINGNDGTLIKEEKNDHLLAPSQCALSRDSSVCNNGNRYFPGKNGEKSRLREQKLGTVAQQKEE
ncbi:Constitutive coactivator of PPAR-gamma-like protein 2 [Camelus dromedarius]|uniref:Constitutive coactivator of PPAR-gamma-like protein 2 n=1 Tax=Camelus dromedarius TaxID=9838 RepID=A0A5N4C0W9_CAMDR|nr:Constitutive coactivator of PPAR-gamma-like protein 2 [Camelus dromedarius]